MTTDKRARPSSQVPPMPIELGPLFAASSDHLPRVICNVSDADRGYLAGADNYLWQSLVLRKHYGTCSIINMF